MREAVGDMFDHPEPIDAIVITTNGYRKTNGIAVMGRGCAKQAADLWSYLPHWLGTHIRCHGNTLGMWGTSGTPGGVVVTFPVKPISEPCAVNKANVVQHQRHRMAIGGIVPGWACVAQLEIIERSTRELVALTDKHGWTDVVMPRPGCGAGELRWKDVKALIEPLLDDRFIVYNFK